MPVRIIVREPTFFCEFAVKDGEGERDNLHDQQHDHHIHAAQPAGIAEYRRHMDDGAHAVDVKRNTR